MLKKISNFFQRFSKLTKGKEILRWIYCSIYSISVSTPFLTPLQTLCSSPNLLSIIYIFTPPSNPWAFNIYQSPYLSWHWGFSIMPDDKYDNYKLWTMQNSAISSCKRITEGRVEAIRAKTSDMKNGPDMWKFVNSLSRLREKQTERTGMTGSDLNFKITKAAVWN